jgi:hypothetical protein
MYQIQGCGYVGWGVWLHIFTAEGMRELLQVLYRPARCQTLADPIDLCINNAIH